MNRLPTYVLANDSELPGGMILRTESPMIIGKPYKVHLQEREKLIAMSDRMREGTDPIAKVDGYTLFITRWSVLDGVRVDYDTTMKILKEMAEYYLNAEVLKHKHRYKEADESRL